MGPGFQRCRPMLRELFYTLYFWTYLRGPSTRSYGGGECEPDPRLFLKVS